MEKRIYFKNLNALRFIAATLVIFHHVEQYKLWAKLPNIFGHTTIDALGHKAVSFFFVLSGFLITYLLMAEEQKSGRIDVRSFYIRRILRIWPLYYFIVLICLFVLPNIFDLSVFGSDLYSKHFPLVTSLLLLVLPNLVRLFQPGIVGGNQLWSIGVEEQFYLVWPLLVRWFMKSMLVFLMAFIGLKLVTTVLLELLVLNEPLLLFQKALRFWELLQVEQMAIGAIGAWCLFNKKERVLKTIYHPITHYASILLVGLLFTVPIHHWWINYAEAVIFSILILNLSTNSAIKLNLEGRAFNVLGNISYGIYMYHTICITICFYCLRQFGLHESNYLLFNILLYTLSVITTITLAYFSYEYMEKKFLEFKEKFMVVKSGKQDSGLPVSMESKPQMAPSVSPVKERTNS